MHVCSPVRAVCSKLVTLTYSCCPSPWCRYCEELPVEENIEQSHDTSNNLSKNPEAKPDVSPLVPHRPFPEISPPELPSTEPPEPVSARDSVRTVGDSKHCIFGHF